MILFYTMFETVRIELGIIHIRYLTHDHNIFTTKIVLYSPDEGVYVDTNGKVTKNVVLQWGELPTSVGKTLQLMLI